MENDEVEFRISSFTDDGDPTCVEVGFGNSGEYPVMVRNSKDRGGPVLRFNHAEWDAFLKGVRAGEFG